MSTTTFVGILVAITGNVLISFALNLQKLVHKRIEEKYSESDAESSHKVDSRHPVSPLPEEQEEEEQGPAKDQARSSGQGGEESETPQRSESSTLLEIQPVVPAVNVKDYGAISNTTDPGRDQAIPHQGVHPFASRLVPFKLQTQNGVDAAAALPVEVVSEASALHGLGNRQKTQKQNSDESNVDDNEGLYLKSKLWSVVPGFSITWPAESLGQVAWLSPYERRRSWKLHLIRVCTSIRGGTFGNCERNSCMSFPMSYQTSQFALIANCFFAPIMLKERFRKVAFPNL
jgi:magnesium transporter